ncbi:hypothetical protein Pla52nx_003270 [Stieleria varia]
MSVVRRRIAVPRDRYRSLVPLFFVLVLMSGCGVETPTQNRYVTDDVIAQLSELGRLHELPGAMSQVPKSINGSPTRATKDSEIISIELYNAPVTGDAVETLVKLPQLQQMHFHADQVNDDVFQAMLRNGCVHKWYASISGHAARANMGEAVDDDSKIVELKFNRSVVSPKSLEMAIAQLPSLQRVDLSEFILDEHCVATLLPMGKLHVARRGRGFARAFNANGQQATSDTEITHLSLKTVHGDYQLSSTVLPQLKSLPNLKTLNLNLTDHILSVLGKEEMLHLLPGASNEAGERPESDDEINSLALETSTRGDVLRDLKWVTQLPMLRQLNLSACLVDNTSLALLNGNTQLTHLTLGPGINDIGLSLIGELPSLQSLCLDHTRVTVDGLSRLDRFEQLVEFELFNDNLTKEHMAQIAKLAKLDIVTLEVTAINDHVVSSLVEQGKLHGLKSHFRGNRRQLASSSEQLASQDTAITRIDLSGCPISGGVLSCFHSLPQLCDVSLRGTFACDDVVLPLCEVPSELNLDHLDQLDVRNTDLTEVALRRLRDCFPNCEFVSEVR